MERVKGFLGKDGVERYFKIINETLDKNDLCNGYSVNFNYDIKKEKTTLNILKFAHGVPIKILLYNKFYCEGEPVIVENTFEKEFEKHKHEFAA